MRYFLVKDLHMICEAVVDLLNNLERECVKEEIMYLRIASLIGLLLLIQHNSR